MSDLLFGRGITVEIDNSSNQKVTYTDSPFTIQFHLDLSKKTTGNVTIYNIDHGQFKLPEKNDKKGKFPKLKIIAGYGKQTGVVFDGVITGITTTADAGGVNKKVTFKLDDGGDWKNIAVKKSYKKMAAEKIIKDILTTAGLAAGKIKAGDNKTIKFAPKKTLDKTLVKICRATESRFFLSGGKVHVAPLKAQKITKQASILMDFDSGLLGTPNRDQSTKNKNSKKSYEIKSLFRHQIALGTIVEVRYKKLIPGDKNDKEEEIKLKLEVVKVSHDFAGSGDKALTKFTGVDVK